MSKKTEAGFFDEIFDEEMYRDDIYMNAGDLNSEFDNANEYIMKQSSRSDSVVDIPTTSNIVGKNTNVNPTVMREGSLARSKTFLYDKTIKQDTIISYLVDERRTAVVIAKNGVFELVRSKFGIFCIKSNQLDLPVPSLCDFNFTDKWFIPKPDYDLLLKLWKLNMHVMKTNNGAEFYAALIWDTNKEEYEIFIPEQIVSKAAVEFEQFKSTDTRFMVIDHHSHNTMGAFFSGTDNNNDYSKFKISLVMGQISKINFDTKQRIVINTKFKDIKLSDIFNNIPDDTIDEELLKLVNNKVKKYTSPVYDIRNVVPTSTKSNTKPFERVVGIKK